MRVIRRKPSEIIWHKDRVTSVFTEEEQELLSALVKEMGIIGTIPVQEIDGKIYGIDGYHRCQEAIKNGDKMIDLAVVEGDIVDLLCKNLIMDRARGRHTPSQMVRLIKSLCDNHGMDSEKIAKRTGLKRDYIEKYLKIATASPGVFDALDRGIIGIGHAFEVSRLPQHVQQEEMVAKYEVYRFSIKDLKSFIDEVLRNMEELKVQPETTTPTQERPAPVYKCEACKHDTDPRYLRPAILCPDCFGNVWRLAKAKEEPKAAAPDDREGA